MITGYLFELSKVYSRFYHNSSDSSRRGPEPGGHQVALSAAVLHVLRNAFALIGIPFLEKM
jgi:arginyl-tRNA synthetase